MKINCGKKLDATRYHYVLFDLDGTILDSEGVSAFATNYAFKKVLGRELTESEEKSLIGRPVKYILKDWYGETGEEIYRIGSTYFNQQAAVIRPYRGIKTLIADLYHKGAKMAVVTTSHTENSLKLLKLNGILRYLVTVIGQEDTERHKPDPDPVLLALQRMRYNGSGNAIFVGDQPADIYAARNAGIIDAAALWGAADEEVIESCKPKYTFKKIRDFREFIFLSDVKK